MTSDGYAMAVDDEHKLGEGAYGVVYGATHVETGRAVAIKRVVEVLSSRGTVAQLLREIRLHRRLNDECGADDETPVARLLEVLRPPRISDFTTVDLVFERLECDLRAATRRWWRDQSKTDALETVRRAAHGLLTCLARLHEHRIAHRDVKPQNVLVDGDRVVVCDLGMARDYSETLSSNSSSSNSSNSSKSSNSDDEFAEWTDYVTTRWYRAPEVLAAVEHGPSADLWSAGCVLAEMLRRGCALLPGKNTKVQARLIGLLLGPPSPETSAWFRSKGRHRAIVADMLYTASRSSRADLSALVPDAPPEAIDLIRQLLTYEPSRRPSAEAALRHAYFDGLPAFRPSRASSSSPPCQPRIASTLFSNGGDPDEMGADEKRRARSEIYREIVSVLVPTPKQQPPAQAQAPRTNNKRKRDDEDE
jgi:serine/threonine protein kinase